MSDRVKCITYSRKSRNVEGFTEEESLETQMQSLILYAKNKGYEILKNFKEVGSSVDDERKQLNLMMDYISKNSVQVVVISAIDRIARSVGIFEKFLQICKDRNIVIETLQGTIDLSREGSEVLALLQSVLAKSEYSYIRNRLIKGKFDAVSVNKRWISSTAPFGYKYDKEKKILVIDEEKAPTYRLMVSFALENYSYAEIARKLNDMGLTANKSGFWTTTKVQKALTKRTYLGEAEYNSSILNKRAHATNCHEPLISYEDFEKISELASSRNTKGSRAKSGEVHTILNGMIYCNTCGRKRAVFKQRNCNTRTRKTQFVMIQACHHWNEDGSRCKDGGCKVSHVEEIVIDYLKKYQKNINKELENISQVDNTEKFKNIKTQINDMKTKIKSLETITLRAKDAYLGGVMELDEYSDIKIANEGKINSLKIDIEQREKVLSELDTNKVKNEVKKKIKTIDKILNNESINIRERNRLLSLVIDKIYISKELGVVGKPSKVKIVNRM